MSADIQELLRLEDKLKREGERSDYELGHRVERSIGRDAKVNLLKYLQVIAVKRCFAAFDALFYELEREGGLECLRDIAPFGGRDLLQPKVMDPRDQGFETTLAKQLQFYLEDAEVAKEHLDTLVAQAVKNFRACKILRVPVKSRENAKREAIRFCGGDVRKISDMAKVTVICDKPEDLKQAYVAIVELLQPRDIFRVGNGFIKDWTPTGYRNVNVFPVVNGHLCEIFLGLREFETLRSSQHVVFEWTRELDVFVEMRSEDFFHNVAPEVLEEMMILAQQNWHGTANYVPDLQLAAGQYDLAEVGLRQLLKEAEDVERAIGGEDRKKLREAFETATEARERLGCLLVQQGKYEEAESLLACSLATREKHLGSNHLDVAGSLNNLAGLLTAKGMYDHAGLLYIRAIEIGEKCLGPDHPLLASWLNNRAVLCEKQGIAVRISAIPDDAKLPMDPLSSTRLSGFQYVFEIFRRPGKGDETDRWGTAIDWGKYDEAEPLYQRALAIDERELGAEHPAVAKDLNNWAGLLGSQGKYDEAEPLYERSRAIREKVLGPEHPDVAVSLNMQALLLEAQGKYDAAEPLYERSQSIREKVLGPEHPDVAQSLNNRAGLLKAQGKYAEAETLFQRAQAIREKVLGPEHPDVAQSLNNLARLLRAQGKYTEADPLYERCQAIEEKVLGPDHPSLATTLNNRAELLRVQGKYAEAAPLYERCQAIEEKVLGPEHPNLATTLNNRAGLLESQGKSSEAGPLYKRTQEIYEKSFGVDHLNVATILNNRAGWLYRQGKYAEAEPLYERCQTIEERVLGPEHPSLATTLNNRAGLLQALGKLSKAESVYKRAQEIFEKSLGRDHSNVATLLNNRAQVSESQGKYEKAGRLHERSLSIREKAFGTNHPAVATALNNMAGLLSAQGKYDEAEPYYDRSLSIRLKALGPEHPDVAQSLNNRAGLLEKQGMYDHAGLLYIRAIEIGEKCLGPDHPLLASWLNNRAVLCEKQGKYYEAEALFERSQDIREKAAGPTHPDVAESLDNRASLLEKQGKYSEAEALYVRAIAIGTETLGPESPKLAKWLNNWAGLKKKLGNYAEAEELYERSQIILENVFGVEHPNVATTLNHRARLLRAQGGYKEAMPLCQRSVLIREKALGPYHPDTAESLNYLAWSLDMSGKYEEAEVMYRRSLEILEHAHGSDHPAVAVNLDGLGGVLLAQGLYAEAEPLFRRSLAVRESSLGPEHPDVAQSLTRLGILLEMQGKLAEAEHLYERCVLILETSLGSTHPSVAIGLNNLAQVQFLQSKHDEAARQSDQALSSLEARHDLGSTNVVAGLPNLAAGRVKQGDYDGAKTLYKRALDSVVMMPGENNPQAVNLRERLGKAVDMLQAPKDPSATAKAETTLGSPFEVGARNPKAIAKPHSKLDSPSDNAPQGRVQLLPEIMDSELHLAVKRGNTEMVEVLLVRDVRPLDPDVRGGGDMTPLHEATYHRHDAIVQMLLRHGADPNLGNVSGRTPLHIACAHASKELVTILLDWGADPLIRDHQGLLPVTHVGPDPDPELEYMLAPAECGCTKTRILAQSLGCDANVFASVTFGVELELEDGSLDAEVCEPVTIDSEIRMVQCSDERDTSRTHEELTARAAERIATDPSTKAFVAMPLVHGPSTVKFNEKHPAKLRFFVGFVTDFEGLHEEDGCVKGTSDNLKAQLLRKYEPLVSPDGVFWTMQRPFEVVMRPQRGLQTEIWLETKIYHFSTFALADVNPGYAEPDSDVLADRYIDGEVPRRLPPWKRSIWSRKKPKLFLLGNATTTQDDVLFYTVKNIDFTAATVSGSVEATLNAVGGGGGVGKNNSRQVAMIPRGIGNIFKWSIPKGRYKAVPTFSDGGVIHDTVTVVVGFEKEQSGPPRKWDFYVLDIMPLQVNNMLIITPARMEEWKKRGGETLQSCNENDVLDFVVSRNRPTSHTTISSDELPGSTTSTLP